MGLAADLSYDLPRPNAFQRGVQAFTSTRAGARIASRWLAPMERVVARWTRGRTSVPRLLVALPVLRVTTTGRRLRIFVPEEAG